MTLESERQYKNVLKAYREARTEIEDLLLEGISHDELRSARDILHDLENDLIDYENRSGKALITQRTPWVQTEEDLSVLSDYLNRASESAGTKLLRLDIEWYRERREAGRLAEEGKA